MGHEMSLLSLRNSNAVQLVTRKIRAFCKPILQIVAKTTRWSEQVYEQLVG